MRSRHLDEATKKVSLGTKQTLSTFSNHVLHTSHDSFVVMFSVFIDENEAK